MRLHGIQEKIRARGVVWISLGPPEVAIVRNQIDFLHGIGLWKAPDPGSNPGGPAEAPLKKVLDPQKKALLKQGVFASHDALLSRKNAFPKNISKNVKKLADASDFIYDMGPSARSKPPSVEGAPPVPPSNPFPSKGRG